MDDFLNALYLDKPFPLSWEEGDNLNVTISSDVLQFCAKPDMHALDFLYTRYRRGLRGVILNPEEDINTHLQVSTLLGALHKALSTNFVVLILCPDNAVVKWHYYMTLCGGFEIKIITDEYKVNQDEINRGTILLVTFSNIKLVDLLLDINFFSVIIDTIDEVANKLIVRKLQGNFNIGVTFRNFYTNPDQKLQWSVLNWANQGCVGKLADFYEIDNDNFNNFRDQYKEWWFRITWHYCDSFEKPSFKNKFEHNEKLRSWAKEYNLLKYTLGVTVRKKRKKKLEYVKPDSDKEIIESKRLKNKNTKEIFNEVEKSDSNDTIIYGEQNNSNEKDMFDLVAANKVVIEIPIINEIENNSNEKDMFDLVAANNKVEIPEEIPIIQKDSSPEMESELFLKSLATPFDVQKIEIASNEEYINSILKGNSDTDESKNTSEIKLEVSEENIDVAEDIPSESDNYFRSIFSSEDVRSNTQVETTSVPMSDVDALVAEVMEMIADCCAHSHPKSSVPPSTSDKKNHD
ncbi:unnamed protein product [Ceutorhynchus assimilis]|uniref:Uncharacterized protein n=1 Tax=Ceutorhynchus assimilis TaxID=467358 RepID=A0A9N9MXY9_9CUCU|nr:unnamed protein product [Ceutorhynchus assimilis]